MVFGCAVILILVGFCVFHFIGEMYEDGTEWIKDICKAEKEMALKRIWEEKNGTPFIPKKEEFDDSDVDYS